MKFYKCPICGNIVEMVVDHGVPIMCCGTKMELMVAGSTDAATEKHVPVAKVENGVLYVSVGSVEHPSTQEHLIDFIAVKAGTNYFRKSLKAGDKPEAYFHLNGYTGPVEVYEYCNLHGLWKSELTA